MIILLASGSRMRAAQPSWSSPVGLQYSMPVYLSVVDSNNAPLTNSGNLVAIFNGSTIAGVLSNPVVIGGKSVYQGTIWSTNATNSGFTAQFYNASSDGVWSLTNLITFSSGSGTNFSSYGSVSNPVTSVASPQTQTLAFPALAGVTYSNGLTIGLGATSSSGLSVSYGSASTNVSLAGTNVTVLGAGTASIVASQAGNSNYAAAPPVTNALVIAKATPAFSIDSNSLNVVYTGGSAAVALVNAGGIPYVITYNGSTNLPVAAGTYTVVASVSDTNNYTAYSVTNTLVIARSSTNTITFPSLSGVTYSNGLTVGLGATASSGLSVSYSSTSTNVSISGTNVTVLGAGTASIVASQAGNSNYLAATPVTNSLVVAQASATVTISGTNAIYNGTAKTVTVGTTPSGLSNSVTYNGSATAPTNVGSYTVVATVSDANYTGSGTSTLTIAQASNTITFPSLGGVTYSNGLTVGLGATSSSGLSVSYSSTSTNVSISGTNVTVLGAGTASIVASQAGNSNYLAATLVTNSLVVTNASVVTPTNVTYIGGSSAFASAAVTAITNWISTNGGSVIASDNANLRSAKALVATYTNASGTCCISARFTGSAMAIQSAASPAGTNLIAFAPYNPVHTGLGNLTASDYTVLTNAKAVFSDVYQAATKFSGSFGGVTYATLASGNSDSAGKIAVTSYNWVGSVNLPASATNISGQFARALLSSGKSSLALMTGTLSDSNSGCYLMGLNVDSGVRITTFAETGFGTLSTAVQYAVGTNFTTNAYGATILVNPATDTNKIFRWPTESINGVSSGSAGNGGYAAGKDLCQTMTRALVSGTNLVVIANSTTNGVLSNNVRSSYTGNNYLIGYAGRADAEDQTNNGLKLLGYNGMVNTTNAVANGGYTFWSYEHVYMGTTTNAQDVALLRGISTAVSNTITAPNLPVGAMKVIRSTDGGVVIGNY